VIEGFSDVLTELLLMKTKHTKAMHPHLGHADAKNSSMDGFLSFLVSILQKWTMILGKF
jgi:hypothetical protein